MLKLGMTIVPYLDYEAMVELSKYVDARGFDSIWVWDHIAPMSGAKGGGTAPLEVWSILTSLAISTKKVKLGTCVTDAFRRHPAVTAEIVTTLDVISGGRAILGIGAGEAFHLDPYGITWDKPVSRLEEAIKIIKQLWSEDYVNYDGEFYTLRNAIVARKFVQRPHPPIWIGAVKPRTLNITGKLGDGWLPVFQSPELYKENLDQIRKSALSVGRDPNDIEAGLVLPIGTADTYDSVEQEFLTFARNYISHEPDLLTKYGFDKIPKDLDFRGYVYTEESARRREQMAKDIPIELVRRLCVFGTPDDCIDRIEKYVDAGLKHVQLLPLGSPEFVRNTIRLCAEEILPYFKTKR